MATDVLTRLNIRERAAERREDEHKMAAVLDSCLERIHDGRQVSFVLGRTPEAGAEVRTLLPLATLLSLRGRLIRDLVA